MTNFQKNLILLKSYCKTGDIAAIAEKANCTTQTVRNMFKRADESQLTPKEHEALRIFEALALRRKQEEEEAKQIVSSLAKTI